MKYIYLDWNVIKYMKGQVVTDKYDGFEFEKLFNKLSKRFKFPYSESHLRDLLVSDKDDNPKVKEDLDYLMFVSEGFGAFTVGHDVVINKSDVHEHFEYLKSEPAASMDFDVTGESFEIDTDKMHSDSAYKKLIEENDGVLDGSVVKRFIESAAVSMDDPDWYKNIREQISRLKKDFESESNTVLDQNSEYYKSVLPFLEFLADEAAADHPNKFPAAVQGFLSISGKKIEDLENLDKLHIGYQLLDFHPAFKEKIKKKNKPSNLVRDMLNVIFAAKATYYVSEDGNSRKKAKYIYSAFSLPVKVVGMNEFVSRFC